VKFAQANVLGQRRQDREHHGLPHAVGDQAAEEQEEGALAPFGAGDSTSLLDRSERRACPREP